MVLSVFEELLAENNARVEVFKFVLQKQLKDEEPLKEIAKKLKTIRVKGKIHF